jgi:hypothetical protein
VSDVLSDDRLDRSALAATSGRQGALDVVVENLHGRVLARKRRVLPNPADAEDAAQEALFLRSRRIASSEGCSRFTIWLASNPGSTRAANNSNALSLNATADRPCSPRAANGPNALRSVLTTTQRATSADAVNRVSSDLLAARLAGCQSVVVECRGCQLGCQARRPRSQASKVADRLILVRWSTSGRNAHRCPAVRDAVPSSERREVPHHRSASVVEAGYSTVMPAAGMPQVEVIDAGDRQGVVGWSVLD